MGAGHQILGHVLEVGLHGHGAEFAVVPQVPQVVRVLLEVPGQLLALQQLLADLARARVADAEAGDGAEGVGHAVAEGADLLHVEVVGVDFLASLGLVLGDSLEGLFVVLGGWERGCFVLVIEFGRYDE